VTTNDVVVSPLVAGEVNGLLVNEGDTVKRGQLLATIRPDEPRADLASCGHTPPDPSEEGSATRAPLA
jgi:multidrug efflux pump subunit AcrA (membrane-fusion protein)